MSHLRNELSETQERLDFAERLLRVHDRSRGALARGALTLPAEIAFWANAAIADPAGELEPRDLEARVADLALLARFAPAPRADEIDEWEGALNLPEPVQQSDFERWLIQRAWR